MELDYNLWERNGMVYVSCYKMFLSGTETNDPIFTESLGSLFLDNFANVLGVKSWAGFDEWFTEAEWKAITQDVFAGVFNLPADVFA